MPVTLRYMSRFIARIGDNCSTRGKGDSYLKVTGVIVISIRG